jgi:rhodanese-related sulfurtransferase
MHSNGVPVISVQELKELRDGRKPHLLIDVREPSEYAASRIDGAKLLPLAELPGRFGELPKDTPIIVHCHHGGRSAQAVRFLKEAGFEDVKNLSGGIDAWSADIDPDVPRY